jgi:RND family efflux transporter MFP subunit
MKTFLKVLFSLILLALAVMIAVRLVKTRPQARRAPQTQRPPLVEVVTVRGGRERIGVSGMGTVIPSRKLALQPEVSGTVISSHPDLVAGGRIGEGEEVIRIDPRDYELAVEQQKANVERARVEMQLEEGRRTLAEVEWKLFETDIPFTEAGKDLALRKPQLRSAEVSLENALNGLKRAELNVERTGISAPFNALVLEETVEKGQLVTPQFRLATLVGTDQFWVQTAIPLERIGRVKVRGKDGSRGSPARIIQETGSGGRIERRGEVVRFLADLDPVGRMARLIVAVDDPLGIGGPSTIPLLLGSYVRVEIEGKEREQVFSIPRTAMREGSRIWLLNDDSRLEIREVDILWRTADRVMVHDMLRDGDRIVVSRIQTPVSGMQLRLQEEGREADPAAGEEDAPVTRDAPGKDHP